MPAQLSSKTDGRTRKLTWKLTWNSRLDSEVQESSLQQTAAEVPLSKATNHLSGQLRFPQLLENVEKFVEEELLTGRKRESRK